MKNLLLKLMVKLFAPLQAFLQKHNPPMIVLSKDKDFENGFLNFSQQMLEARVKQLEMNSSILSYKVITAMEEHSSSINALQRGQEEILHLFSNPEDESEPDLDPVTSLINVVSVTKSEIN